MTGTKAGGRKAALTNLNRHGSDFYARIGSRGGKRGHDGGFATASQMPCDCWGSKKHKNKAGCAGAKGGAVSRRIGTPNKR